jgi:hypothetical protein
MVKMHLQVGIGVLSLLSSRVPVVGENDNGAREWRAQEQDHKKREKVKSQRPTPWSESQIRIFSIVQETQGRTAKGK